MKRILLLFSFILLIHSGLLGQKPQTSAQGHYSEVDLTVNGIKSGSSYSSILNKIGKPIKVKKAGFNECGGGFIKTLVYKGLEIAVLSNGKGRNSKVISMKVTSSRWRIAPSVKIGVTKEVIRSLFGNSGGGYPDENVFDYVTKDNLGGVKFYFKGNILIRVEMQETLC